MKKLLLVCTLFLAAVTTYGQGQVFFANDSTTRFTTNGGAGKVGNLTGLNTYRIGMYTAPAGTVNEALFTLTATATNSSSPIAPGQFSYPESPYTFAANNGTAIAVQIRAWSLAAGATYEAAVATGNPNYYGGKTAIGAVTPAVGGAAPPSLFGAGAVFTSGVVLTPLVPEPSSIALGLLGLGAIALFRRRK